ncbi:MAG TPA: hypothetical protein VFL96_01055 [Acidobacteriaceae bacterium]|nr:hypothetical protein [Acidobacteriaceae bacterium]
MPDTRLRIAVREFSDFENALAEQMALFCEGHPEVEFEAVPLDLHMLHAELFEKSGLRSGAWDIGYVSTDWLTEAVDEGVLEELTPWVSATLENRVTEYVGHLHEHFADPVRMRNAHYLLPEKPDYSAEIYPETLRDYSYPDGLVWNPAYK